jgi:hypothetical protein
VYIIRKGEVGLADLPLLIMVRVGTMAVVVVVTHTKALAVLVEEVFMVVEGDQVVVVS